MLPKALVITPSIAATTLSLRGNCEAYLPRCTVGSRQAEHESRRVEGREDDMVMRVGNSLVGRRTDEGGRVASPSKGQNNPYSNTSIRDNDL